MKNLHVAILDKFIPPYIDFVLKHFNADDHCFVLVGEPHYNYGLTTQHPVRWINSITEATEVLESAYRIILHGLWNEQISQILCTRPYLLKRCFWIMWGGDYHFPERHSDFKKYVIKHVRYMTSWGSEHQYVIDNYDAQGIFFESILYPYVIYKETKVPDVNSEYVTVQLGNSADPTNDHTRMLEIMAQFRDEAIKMICPLSYSGTREYANAVAEGGKRVFGDKFIPLLEYMPYEDYLKYLAETDIAFFNHNRQQAMGNTFNLISLGKKVYIGYKPVREFLLSLGFHVFDPQHFSLIRLRAEEKSTNIEIAKEYLKEENYIKHLEMVFELPVN